MSFQSILVVQARLMSRRLPFKVLLPLRGSETVLGTVLHNLYGSANTHILSCPQSCESQFSPIAKKHGYEIVGGPEEDVLARIFLAYQRFPAPWIIRATADNAVVGTSLAQKLLKDCQRHDADYGCYKGTPRGGSVQVISNYALIAAEEKAWTSYEREHVCPFIIHRTSQFKIHTPMAPFFWRGSKLRATIDFLKDYEYIYNFYRNCYCGTSEILEEFITWAQTT